MGFVIDTGAPRHTKTMTTAEQCIEGYLYKMSTDDLTLITAKGDLVRYVGLENSLDPDGTAKTAGNCIVADDGIVNVASKTGTYRVGGYVYASDDVDGMATPTDPTSGTIIGTYEGKAAKVIGTEGDFVSVRLNITGKSVTS